MATPTYDLLDSTTLSSSASSVSFSSIDQSYRDLILVVQGTALATSSVRMRVNGDTGNNYSYVFMRGDGSSATSVSGAAIDHFATNAGFYNTTGGRFTMQFLDYSATDKHKTTLTTSNYGAARVAAAANRWASTSAITSVEVFFTSTSFASGSTFYLYGVAA